MDFSVTVADGDSRRAAARFHDNVDQFVELPILFAVLITIQTTRCAVLATEFIVSRAGA